MNRRLKGGLVFLVLGAAFFAAGAYPAYQYHQTVSSAEPVTAEVVSSDYDRMTGSSSGDQEYYVNVTYTFAYEGETYTSDREFSSERNGNLRRARAERISENHAPGDEVTAHVIPGNPEKSFLIKEERPYWHYLIPGFGALLAILGAINLVQGVRGVGPMTSSD